MQRIRAERIVRFLGISLLCATGLARADIALLVEEPYGTFGGMNPTGHSAIYLSRVCADTPISLRPCQPGEPGTVISRYHRVGGYDWVAIPLIPYLYAVERADQVPASATREEVAALRDGYRRRHLKDIVPDASDGSTPLGDWTQLVGESYDRTIFTFGLETTKDLDYQLIAALNLGTNRNHFKLLSHNCANFAQQVINFYFPKAIQRSFLADVGIMTPKQAAKSLVHYSRKHSDLQFSSFTIAQVPGTIPRSSHIRGVLESLTKSKRYAVPLVPLALLHPVLGGGMAFAWLEGSHFNPAHVAETDSGTPLEPDDVANELLWNGRSAAVAAE
jgi:hypothetical protein